MFLLPLACLLHLVLPPVLALSAPPTGAITIGGPSSKYATVSAALQDTSSSVYFIFPGTYNEQVVITRSNITIYGQTSIAESYAGNTVTITDNIPASKAGSNDASGTVQVHATNVSLYNVNIANTFGTGTNVQAIALSVQAGQFGAYGLKITGFQDTLLANKGVQFYANSWIEGGTDFIFGMQASILITNSTINTLANGNGMITASGRSSDDANWYVIDNSVVRGTGTVFLGRPWRDWARVVFQNSNLDSSVAAAGWSVWNSSTPLTDHVTFAEYNNSGAGSSTGARASFSSQLSSPISVVTVLGSTYTSWVDSSFL